MAEISFGVGTSHSPLLLLKPEEWHIRAQADYDNPAHPYRGKVYTYKQLLEIRGGQDYETQCDLSVMTERYDRCQANLDALGRFIESANPDVLVIVGDDQEEWFGDAIQPAFGMFYGEQVLNRTLTGVEEEGRSPVAIDVTNRYRTPENTYYPVPSGFSKHLIQSAVDDGFDITASRNLPNNADGEIGIGHAYSFVYTRILANKPIPLVPVHVNTYYPPNQPSARRCLELGRSIGRAIRSWPGAERVGVVASGGLTHFVIDEELDRRVLDAFRDRDTASLTGIPEDIYQSGTSEIKNWIAVAGMVWDVDLGLEILDYVPCYRTAAGTGCAMGFVTWS